MERRFRVRLDELLNDARVQPSLLRGVLPRLDSFLQPFVEALHSTEQQTNAKQYVQGLLSDLKSKDAESIAYLHDRDRQGLQKFIGQAEWDHQPLLTELVRQVGVELGEDDGVMVFDPSAFPKKGGRNRSESSGSGVAGSARSTTVRSASTWDMCRVANTPWSMFGSICPRSGPTASAAARRLVCRPRSGSARGTS